MHGAYQKQHAAHAPGSQGGSDGGWSIRGEYGLDQRQHFYQDVPG